MNRANLKWVGRLVSIFLLAGAADILVVLLVRKPWPWVLLVPWLVPLLTVAFVIVPMIRAGKHDSPNT